MATQPSNGEFKRALTEARMHYGAPDQPQGGWGPEEWADSVTYLGHDLWRATVCTECSIGVSTRTVDFRLEPDEGTWTPAVEAADLEAAIEAGDVSGLCEIPPHGDARHYVRCKPSEAMQEWKEWEAAKATKMAPRHW